MTHADILEMQPGSKMDRLINERFFGEDRPRAWSQCDQDAVVLMHAIAERVKDLHITFDCGMWQVGSNYAAGPLENWDAIGETFRIAIARAALLMTLEATP